MDARVRQARKMEALGGLAGGIAHEFNNVLGVILGNAGLALADLPPGHPARESLGQIQFAAERAGALVEQILRFAREDPADRQPIPLRQALDVTLPLLRAAIPPAIEIECRCSLDASVTVLAHRTAVHQVLMNLCTNAWQAMDGGRGRIAISLSPGNESPASGDIADGARYAVLSVRDDGAGMDAATLARIFEPFFTTKPVGQGTGLGLSTVRTLVESLGGRILARSTPGVGSEFLVHLPIHAAPVHPGATVAQQGAVTAAAASRDPLRVLVVDDEASVRRFIQRALERRGCAVTTCASGEVALASVRADPAGVDVVLVDLHMPGMSGVDLAASLAGLRPELPVILASGAIGPDVRRTAAEAGVVGFVIKPFAPDALADLLRTSASGPSGSASRLDPA